MKHTIKRDILIITMILALGFLSCNASIAEMTLNEALQTINEYQMNFGKYDSQKLYDILNNSEDHPAYDDVGFASNNMLNPLDTYMVHIIEKFNSQDFLLLKSQEGETLRKLNLYIGFIGNNNTIFPIITLEGSQYESKIVKLTIHADNDYEVTFSGNDSSTFQDGEISATCVTLFDWGINIIRYMAMNDMSLTMDVKFKNGKQYTYNIVREIDSDVNQAQRFLDVMVECGGLSSQYSIQSDIVSFYPDIAKEFSKKTKVTNLSDKKAKAYTEFGDRYGLTLTVNGDSGVDRKQPWFKATVKNMDKKKKVDGFDLVYFGTSVYGDIIELDEGAKLLYQTIIKNINPGATYTTDKLYFYKTEQPKVINAAIRRIHFSDGTMIEIPLRDLFFYSYEIDY